MDVIAASQASPKALASSRQRRLHALLEAVKGSAFYKDRLAHRPATLADVPPDVPPVTKRELMGRFDEWVADPRLTLPELRAFLADHSKIGEAFLDRFTVWESTGSSGEPGIFVQDMRTMSVYDALEAWRRASRRTDPWCVSKRIAFVGAIDGHFASTVSAERLRRINPLMATRLTGISFLQPTAALVAQLNQESPNVISTYPSAAVLLAEEAAAGRLHLRPHEVWTGGETLTTGMRRFIEHELGCKVFNSYGASEFLALATQCHLGEMHLNSDWVILEPVDEHLRPVPLGVAGATTLLTHLANHVQPLIRYDLGDRVAIHSRPCACGSPLPVIDVQGRCDDMLVLHNEDGQPVRLLPLALTTALEEDAGVFDFQLMQTGASALRLSVGGDASCGARARKALVEFLRLQGLPRVRIELRSGVERQRGRSGKRQRIVAAAPGPALNKPKLKQKSKPKQKAAV